MFTPFAFVKSTTAEPAADADATAYLAEVVSVGGTVDGTITSAVNTLFTSLKSNSLYTEIRAMYPIVGGTALSHGIEGKAPTNNDFKITWSGSALTHNASGIIVSASSAGYGSIRKTPAQMFTGIDNIGMGHYLKTLTNTVGGSPNQIGLVANGNGENGRFQFATPDNGGVYFIIGGTGGYIEYFDANPVGFNFGVRRSSTSIQYYLNGTSKQLVTTSNASTFNSTDNIEIFGMNEGARLPTNLTNFVIFTNALDDTQAGTLNTIISTFETSLSRNY